MPGCQGAGCSGAQVPGARVPGGRDALRASGVPVQRNKQRHLNPVNRSVAAILALVWAGIGIAGVVAAYLSGRWVTFLAALFALVYALLWGRVVARARLLNWSELAMPWRGRGTER